MAHRVISLRCGDLSAFGGVADMAGLCCWLDAFANDPLQKSSTSLGPIIRVALRRQDPPFNTCRREPHALV